MRGQLSKTPPLIEEDIVRQNQRQRLKQDGFEPTRSTVSHYSVHLKAGLGAGSDIWETSKGRIS